MRDPALKKKNREHQHRPWEADLKFIWKAAAVKRSPDKLLSRTRISLMTPMSAVPLVDGRLKKKK